MSSKSSSCSFLHEAILREDSKLPFPQLPAPPIGLASNNSREVSPMPPKRSPERLGLNSGSPSAIVLCPDLVVPPLAFVYPRFPVPGVANAPDGGGVDVKTLLARKRRLRRMSSTSVSPFSLLLRSAGVGDRWKLPRIWMGSGATRTGLPSSTPPMADVSVLPPLVFVSIISTGSSNARGPSAERRSSPSTPPGKAPAPPLRGVTPVVLWFSWARRALMWASTRPRTCMRRRIGGKGARSARWWGAPQHGIDVEKRDEKGGKTFAWPFCSSHAQLRRGHVLLPKALYTYHSTTPKGAKSRTTCGWSVQYLSGQSREGLRRGRSQVPASE